MSGSPYIYDREAKKFVTRPSSGPQREPLAERPDESLLPPPCVKPHPSRERRRLTMWLVSAGLLLLWLILITTWTRRLSPDLPVPGSSSRSMQAEFPDRDFPK